MATSTAGCLKGGAFLQDGKVKLRKAYIGKDAKGARTEDTCAAMPGSGNAEQSKRQSCTGYGNA
eukprot:699098-Pelagomonas_calceolata.AAC.3